MGTPLTKLEKILGILPATRAAAATRTSENIRINEQKKSPSRVFYILVHFVAFLRKTTTSNDEVLCFFEKVSAWRQLFLSISYFDVDHSNLAPGKSPCEQSLRLSFSLLRRRKGGCAWIASTLWSHRSPHFWTSQSCFVLSNWFFQCKQPFSGKTDGYNRARCTMKHQVGGEICSKPSTSYSRRDSS